MLLEKAAMDLRLLVTLYLLEAELVVVGEAILKMAVVLIKLILIGGLFFVFILNCGGRLFEWMLAALFIYLFQFLLMAFASDVDVL